MACFLRSHLTGHLGSLFHTRSHALTEKNFTSPPAKTYRQRTYFLVLQTFGSKKFNSGKDLQQLAKVHLTICIVTCRCSNKSQVAFLQRQVGAKDLLQGELHVIITDLLPADVLYNTPCLNDTRMLHSK